MTWTTPQAFKPESMASPLKAIIPQPGTAAGAKPTAAKPKLIKADQRRHESTIPALNDVILSEALHSKAGSPSGRSTKTGTPS
jgi:hypothetical protein